MASTSSKKNIYINGLTCGQPKHFYKTAAAGTFGFSPTAAAAGLLDGDEVLLDVDGQVLEYHAIAINTLMGVTKVATGLRLPIDDTDNDGIEITGGILAQDKCTFTVGTDGAFHIAARFKVSAITDFEILGVGFRNVGAYIKHQAGVFGAGVTDLAFIGSYGDGNGDGSINTVTELASAGMTATDTTDDYTAAVFELRCNVSAAGVVTFQQDLAADADPAVAPTLVSPTVNTNTLTLAASPVVTPVIVCLKGAANAVTLDLIKLDIGLDES